MEAGWDAGYRIGWRERGAAPTGHEREDALAMALRIAAPGEDPDDTLHRAETFRTFLAGGEE